MESLNIFGNGVKSLRNTYLDGRVKIRLSEAGEPKESPTLIKAPQAHNKL